MKEIKLPITAALISVLSLSGEPNPENVSKGIQDLYDRAVKAEKGLNDLTDETVEKEVKALLDNAIAGPNPKITAKQKELFGKQYAKNPKDLKDVLESMDAFVSVNSKLNLTDTKREGAAGEFPAEVRALMAEGWNKLDRSGRLADLKDLSEDAFLHMYKNQFGYLPNEKPEPFKPGKRK